MLLGKHVQQMRRIRKVDVIVPGPVREQIVHLVERGYVRDGRVDVPAGIELGQVHVSFSIDRIFVEPTRSIRELLRWRQGRRKPKKSVGARLVSIVTRGRNKGKYHYHTGANL